MIKKRILIVDDVDVERAILNETLGKDYDLFFAFDGVEALKLIEIHEAKFDLMLLDLLMPKMDGFKVIEELNKQRLNQEIPVIVITSLNSDLIKKVGEQNVDEIIPKPIDPYFVKKRVANCLNLHEKKLDEDKIAKHSSILKEGVSNDTLFLINEKTPKEILSCAKHVYFDHYRLIDFNTKETFGLSEDGKTIHKFKMKCFEFWGEEEPCKNCFCRGALNGEKLYRIEVLNKCVYVVRFEKVVIENRTYILQMLKDVTNSLVLSERKSQASYSILDYVERAEAYSSKDSFTGLLNKVSIEGKIQEAIDNNKEFSICLLDLDDFKNVNDTFGHIVGDKVILFLSNSIAYLCLNNQKEAGRIGGDEFLIISTQDPKSLISDIESLGHTLEEHVFRKNTSRFTSSFSYGIATYKKGETPTSLINIADENMYKAKKLKKEGN